MLRKLLLPILIVLTVIFIVLAGVAFNSYQKEYAENVQLKTQLAELEGRQKATAGKLEESKKNASELELKLQETNAKLDSINAELATEKAAHAETSNKLEQLQNDLNTQKSMREDLEGKYKQVSDESKRNKEQVRIMQEQKTALEEKIKNLESGAGGVELGKVVVSPEAAQTPVEVVGQGQTKPGDFKATKAAPAKAVKALEGKVMVVNKEFNFVVINLGAKDKLNVGDEFVISRGNKVIGDIKVEKVHEAMSAAGFVPELKDFIRENDKVTQKIK